MTGMRFIRHPRKRARLLRGVWIVLSLAILIAAGYASVRTARPLESPMHYPWITALSALFLIGLGLEIMFEIRRFPSAGETWNDLTASDLSQFAFVTAGAVVTFLAQLHLGLGAVTASALAGILGAILFRRFAVALYCGSFTGMAAPELFRLWPCIVLAGVATGIVFIAGKRLFNGVGGKLGTAALIGCLAAIALSPRELLSADMPEWSVGIRMLIYATLGAVITFMLNVRFFWGPVLASGAVGLAAGLLLPLLHGPDPGQAYAAMVFCASFVGMCGTNRLERTHWIALAGLISGLSFIQTAPYFGGAGGKLGALAFGSVIAVRGLLSLSEKLRLRGRQFSTKPDSNHA